MPSDYERLEGIIKEQQALLDFLEMSTTNPAEKNIIKIVYGRFTDLLNDIQQLSKDKWTNGQQQTFDSIVGQRLNSFSTELAHVISVNTTLLDDVDQNSQTLSYLYRLPGIAYHSYFEANEYDSAKSTAFNHIRADNKSMNALSKTLSSLDKAILKMQSANYDLSFKIDLERLHHRLKRVIEACDKSNTGKHDLAYRVGLLEMECKHFAEQIAGKRVHQEAKKVFDNAVAFLRQIKSNYEPGLFKSKDKDRDKEKGMEKQSSKDKDTSPHDFQKYSGQH